MASLVYERENCGARMENVSACVVRVHVTLSALAYAARHDLRTCRNQMWKMAHFMFITLLKWYVAPVHSYITCILPYLIVCSRMLLVFSRMYSCVLVCYWYVNTRMYSYVTRMLLVCYSYVTRMLLVRYSYVTSMLLVCYSYVTRMYSCGVLVTIR